LASKRKQTRTTLRAFAQVTDKHALRWLLKRFFIRGAQSGVPKSLPEAGAHLTRRYRGQKNVSCLLQKGAKAPPHFSAPELGVRQ